MRTAFFSVSMSAKTAPKKDSAPPPPVHGRWRGFLATDVRRHEEMPLRSSWRSQWQPLYCGRCLVLNSQRTAISASSPAYSDPSVPQHHATGIFHNVGLKPVKFRSVACQCILPCNRWDIECVGARESSVGSISAFLPNEPYDFVGNGAISLETERAYYHKTTYCY